MTLYRALLMPIHIIHGTVIATYT